MVNGSKADASAVYPYQNVKIFILLLLLFARFKCSFK